METPDAMDVVGVEEMVSTNTARRVWSYLQEDAISRGIFYYPQDVKEFVVVITGGGSGLGKAIAEAFSTNGARVYITGRRGALLQKTSTELHAKATLGGSVTAIQGDVSTKDGCAQLIKDISSREDHIDVLINNAGLPGKIDYPQWDPNNSDEVEKALWGSVDDNSFHSTNSVNINGIYFTTVGFVPLLRKSTDPSVIIIVSLAGLINQRAMGTMTYAVSKAAAMHLSKLLAGRFHLSHDTLNKFAVSAAKRCTAGRAGNAEEIVGPCLMLSSKAGGYMNGGHLLVDGGRAMGASINDGLHMPEDTYID
ncbi:hypothetical protein N7493_002754 [Penicillium malachiteum]|uniref:Uncharacterized protein n=1 Tax=Penicillium malachiteum TaxID=1324776 RepID=A0AAD6HT37_9EURO|nr:hypothetical protein N7493_002754 [Penicillium malachiteum]